MVAGIVGVKKIQYDIWGDTVNIASRMESSGEVGRVNISHSTNEKVKDEFRCEHRGKIEAKGEGVIDMYFVDGITLRTRNENPDSYYSFWRENERVKKQVFQENN